LAADSPAAAGPPGHGEALMKKASQFFSEQERKLVEDAVTKAESKTSGEIVPVIATQSGRYDRSEDLFGFFLALIIFGAVWCFFQDALPLDGDWEQGIHLVINLPVSLGILVAGYFLGIILASWFPVLRQPFIPNREMREEVEKAAAEAFQKFRLRRTRDATGVLIYISLYERMVRVMGDDAISQKLDQNNWNDVCQTVLKGFTEKRVAEGLQEAILKCGNLLEKHFPIQPGDVDELSNELKIID